MANRDTLWATIAAEPRATRRALLYRLLEHEYYNAPEHSFRRRARELAGFMDHRGHVEQTEIDRGLTEGAYDAV